MAKPRVFISSTFSDLSEVRDNVSDYVLECGYEPVAFEKDDIPYKPGKTLEESCYDEVKECSMFILLLKSSFGQSTNIEYIYDIKIPDEVKSVTQLEYLFARKIGIPVFVFIHQSSFDEYIKFQKQEFPIDFKFDYLDGINHANFVKELFVDANERYLFKFRTSDEIKQTLKKQWAGLFNDYLRNFQIQKFDSNTLIPINCYKLFYFRKNRGLTIKELAVRSGLSESTIHQIEDVGLKFNRIDTKDFKKTKLSNARKIADTLNCSVGNVKAGLPDDYLTFYLTYYYRNKGLSNKRKTQGKGLELFKTKAIVFDFDGTLTHPKKGETTWEKIWLKLGYGINECAELHRQFSRAKISHKKWCSITEERFKEKKLNKKILNEIAAEIILIDGVKETLKMIYEKGISMYICSGSINYIVSKVLGNLFSYFEEIKTNKFKFDKRGYLELIIGTKFDFEGKSDYLKQIAIENEIQPYEILFIGNSLNDEWAHQSGALTLCVNPRLTNPDQHIQWTYSIRTMNNLMSIKNFINFE